ncbi:hypothetical protein ONZ45_g14638 [Pleurotus djamor]|nr:hypothetical protein ONZ45_g14638 [Pleurotus djamor]
MGASQSRQDNAPETSIQFSPGVVAQLSDNAASPGPSPERQATLDDHVRSRIQAELQHLRAEEEAVRLEIEKALERENLDKEKAMAGDVDEEGSGSVKSSISLLGDLEEIQEKVQRTKQKQNQEHVEAAQLSAQAVVSCYQ